MQYNSQNYPPMQLRSTLSSIYSLLLAAFACIFFGNTLLVSAEYSSSWTQIIETSTATGKVQKVSKKYPIFVEANLPAGRYSKAITVKLTASNSDAQIWYTCKRNGSPGELLKYEKPLVLDRSCALLFFAFTDYQNESKIERSDYTIIYSNDIKLETAKSILSLRNTGTGTVDIGSWEIIAWTGAISIPPGTTLTPDAQYTIGKVDPKSYELKSPEGYLKDSIQVVPGVVQKNIAQSTQSAPPKTILKTESTLTLIESGNSTWSLFSSESIRDISVDTSTWTEGSKDTPVSNTVDLGITTPAATKEVTNSGISWNGNIQWNPDLEKYKASSLESRKSSNYPILIILALLAVSVAGGVNYYKKLR